MRKPIIRAIAFFLALVLIATIPWWLSLVVLIGLTIYFPLYLEVIFFGFLFDTLYSSLHRFPYPALTLATLVLLITMFVRSRIRT